MSDYTTSQNPNQNCECTGPGQCPRHGIVKGRRKFELCAGINCSVRDCERYWNAWERGKGSGQVAAVAQPLPVGITLPERKRGLGDWVASGIKAATFGMVKPCGGCGSRQALLNKWFPASRPPVLPVDLSNSRRHLMFHLWPVAGNGIWQWHCDQLLANADLWNGRRVVAIFTSPDADAVEAVKDKLGNFTDRFIIMPNNPKLREVATWLPMLRQLREFDADQDVTFTAQGKCVRLKPGALDDPNAVTLKWTRAMYETCLAWGRVKPLLERQATAGSFRRNTTPSRGSWGPWHYSGTFYWFRNRDVFARNWEYVPQQFFGTEAWPGHLFHPDEAGVIACDDAPDLYSLQTWNQYIEPQLAAWRNEK
jgi:hypothetical protein